jgi:hypothetical protein
MEISIVNTSHVEDSEIEAIISAIHTVMPEFEKDWNVSGTVTLNGKSDIKLYVSTLKGNASERAFHSFVNVPYGRVIADVNDPVSRMISHEVFEMLVNPKTDKYVGNLELEVCDPVSANSFVVNGIAIADWVTPSWFNYSLPPFNRLNTIKRPRTVAPGGYIKSKNSFAP